MPAVVMAYRHHGAAPALLVLSGAVLVDGDYAVDWGANGGREDYSHRLLRPLHAWELAGLAWLLGRRYPALAPVAAGWACHLALDELIHKVPFRHFLLGYRAWTRFRSGTGIRPRRAQPSLRALSGAAAVGCLGVAGMSHGASGG